MQLVKLFVYACVCRACVLRVWRLIFWQPLMCVSAAVRVPVTSRWVRSSWRCDTACRGTSWSWSSTPAGTLQICQGELFLRKPHVFFHSGCRFSSQEPDCVYRPWLGSIRPPLPAPRQAEVGQEENSHLQEEPEPGLWPDVSPCVSPAQY